MGGLIRGVEMCLPFSKNREKAWHVRLPRGPQSLVMRPTLMLKDLRFYEVPGIKKRTRLPLRLFFLWGCVDAPDVRLKRFKLRTELGLKYHKIRSWECDRHRYKSKSQKRLGWSPSSSVLTNCGSCLNVCCITVWGQTQSQSNHSHRCTRTSVTFKPRLFPPPKQIAEHVLFTYQVIRPMVA